MRNTSWSPLDSLRCIPVTLSRHSNIFCIRLYRLCIRSSSHRVLIASRSDCIRMVFGWSGGCIDEYSTGCVRIAWVIGSIDNTRTARRIGRALAVAWVDMDWEAVFTIDNCMSLCNHMYPTCIQCVSPSSNDTVWIHDRYTLERLVFLNTLPCFWLLGFGPYWGTVSKDTSEIQDRYIVLNTGRKPPRYGKKTTPRWQHRNRCSYSRYTSYCYDWRT